MSHAAIIVGAGPAGVSCAIWLKQLGFPPVLVERNAQAGGLQLQNPYSNSWIASSAEVTGPEVARQLQASLERHQIECRFGVAAQSALRAGADWRVGLSSGESLAGRVVVLAGGVSPKAGGLVARANLLIGPGRPVEMADFRNKKVAILGGGDNAFENYSFVAGKGAREVRIFARSLRARAEMLARVPEGQVSVGPYQSDPSTNTVNGEVFDTLLVLYGWEVHQGSLLGLEVALRGDGFVVTDADCATTLDGVYAIGELAQRAHPCCVTAMADGVVAAKAIQRRLESSLRDRYLGALARGGRLIAKTLRD